MTTSTDIEPTALAAALGEAVPTLLPGIPGVVGMGSPRPIGRPSELPDLGPGSQAVTTGLGAGVGTATIIVTEALAAALCDGPLGTETLDSALGVVLADMVRAVGAALGPALEPTTIGTVDGQVALNSAAAPRRGVSVAGVELRGDSGPIAIVLLTTGEERGDEYVVPELAEIAAPPPDAVAAATGFTGTVTSLDLLADVEMAVTAELGRSRMTVRHLLGLSVGSVVELDRSADSAVDLFVNGTLIARGEVVIIDEEFGVRVTEIVQRGNSR